MGTSIVGTIVAHHYTSVVGRTISVLDAPASSQWLPRFDDPRILVDEALRETLMHDLGAAGLDTSALFDAAGGVIDSYRHRTTDRRGGARGRFARAADFAHHVPEGGTSSDELKFAAHPVC